MSTERARHASLFECPVQEPTPARPPVQSLTDMLSNRKRKRYSNDVKPMIETA
jgi:hypothetical protein